MDIFKTKNLFLATYLLASGHVKFLGLETLDFKTKLFTFSPANIAQKLEAEYLSGGVLPVKDIFAEYNFLKDLLFDRETNGEKYELPI
ncbi:MAG: hypothetical protein G01um10147_238 [Microgenomates group bacterium Gr01-1014_7]|nr:MAG: hypothetical protein G01um10147_238 [Microgenomates group bacterium Gr01-1014_7]